MLDTDFGRRRLPQNVGPCRFGCRKICGARTTIYRRILHRPFPGLPLLLRFLRLALAAAWGALAGLIAATFAAGLFRFALRRTSTNCPFRRHLDTQQTTGNDMLRQTHSTCTHDQINTRRRAKRMPHAYIKLVVGGGSIWEVDSVFRDSRNILWYRFRRPLSHAPMPRDIMRRATRP